MPGPSRARTGALGIRRSAEGPGLLEAPLPALREALVVLEFVGVVLLDPKSRRRLRLDVFRRHRHRLVRPGVVFRRLVHVLAPAAPPPGNHTRTIQARSFFKV